MRMLLAKVAPSWPDLVPWTDRRGRLHPVRAVTFGLLLLPGLWIAVRFCADMMGARPVNAAIHATGYWAIWMLVASLVVSPLKSLAGTPNIVVVRRMVGNAALCYALIHLLLYAADQNWRVLAIASEILKRFYLTIGFAALLGLVALGATSTDGWIRHLGRDWKRLHRLAYGITVLGLVHYVLQSKLDVSQAILAAGVFTWLMLWRALPAGRDQQIWPLLGISLLSAGLATAYEYCWYRFGTSVDPLRVVRAELDVAYGLRPCGQVLMLGLLATSAAGLRRVADGRLGGTLAFTTGLFALGGLVGTAVAFFTGWPMDDVVPDSLSALSLDAIWVALFALLGVARWTLRHCWQRHLIDAVWLSCIAYNLALLATGARDVGVICAAVVAAALVLLGQRVWLVSRQAALLILPAALLLLYQAAALR